MRFWDSNMSNKLLEATLDRVLISTDGFEALCDILFLCVGLLNRVSRTPEGRNAKVRARGGERILVLDTSCRVPDRRLPG